jgi:hypothetical protein
MFVSCCWSSCSWCWLVGGMWRVIANDRMYVILHWLARLALPMVPHLEGEALAEIYGRTYARLRTQVSVVSDF